jgi:hypothetical protein
VSLLDRIVDLYLASHGASMFNVQKATLRIGRRLSNDAEPGAWAGLPTEFLNGGADVIGGASAAAMNTPHQTQYGVSVPKQVAGAGPVDAISIAPDSPIGDCNLHIGNGQTFRIGVGAPFIGRIDDFKDVRISPARGIPGLYRTQAAIPTTAQYRTYVRVWECPELEIDDLHNYDGLGAGRNVCIPKLPLKLHFYRGEAARAVGSQLRRSIYAAEVLWRSDGGAMPPTLFVITDGRRRVRVRASRQTLGEGGQAAQVSIWGVDHMKSCDAITASPNSGRFDLPTFDELLPATALPDDSDQDIVFDWNGNPYFAFLVQITNGAGASPPATARGHMSVEAYDE